MDSNVSLTPSLFLEANSQAYEWLVERVLRLADVLDEEALLRQIEHIARFAVSFHSGRFADGAIENLALNVGSRLTETSARSPFADRYPSAKGKARRILHVSNRVEGVGGHTRLMAHWIRGDQNTCHSILLLDQENIAIPDWLADAVHQSGGTFFELPSDATLGQKARWMRQIAQNAADLVVLHHFGWDVVPTVALASPNLPPVAVLNHADHIFWLGSSVTDIVINLRSVSIDHTMQRRLIARNTVLPVPLVDTTARVSKREARAALGIPDDQLMLLSVGRAEKYRPCGSYDFVGTAGKILDREPRAHLYVVGESEQGMAPYLQSPMHNNMSFVGEVEDPTLYRAAADLYIESFPFGSQTTLLEAALAELPVVPAYAPLNPLLVANDDAIVAAVPNPASEEEYIERAFQFMQRPDLRAAEGRRLRELLLVDHIGDGWLNRLNEIYQETDPLRHTPAPIAMSPRRADKGDIGLSLWQAMRQPKIAILDAMGRAQLAASYQTYTRLRAGDYRGARRSLVREVLRAPFQKSSWSLAELTIRGHFGPPLRRLKAWYRRG